MYKFKITLLLLLPFLSSPCLEAQTVQTSLNKLKVMTWNVWYGFSRLDASKGIIPSDHPYSANQVTVQQKATDFLTYEAADVVALQELDQFDQNKLSNFASSYGHDYALIFDRDNKQPTGITSKYPLTFLEGKHDSYNGTNLEGTFAAKLTNEPFVFIVVHLKSSNKDHRIKETNYVLELFKKYKDAGNNVLVLGDFNAMTISDRSYAEANIDKRLQYRIFKNKCKGELNKVNQPEQGIAACSTWDYSVMDTYWSYTNYTIIDTTHKYAEKSDYQSSQFWGTFPSKSVSFFHDTNNLDGAGNSTTTHTQAEHLARIDYILADQDLADTTSEAKIIHSYNKDGNTVLIDEMTDHYPLSTTFNFTDNLGINTINSKTINIYPNPSSNGSFTIAAKETLKDCTLELFDSKNCLVKRTRLKNQTVQNIQNTSLVPAVYFLRIVQQQNTYLQKLIIL